MFFDQLLLVDQESFVHRSEHCNLLFLQLEKKKKKIKQRVSLLSENLGQISNPNIVLCFYCCCWLIFILVVLLEPDFNCCNSFALSLVDKNTTET